MTKLYHVTTGAFCCGVVVNEKGIIIETAPILQKFKGQHIDRLKSWIQFIKGTITE